MDSWESPTLKGTPSGERVYGLGLPHKNLVRMVSDSYTPERREVVRTLIILRDIIKELQDSLLSVVLECGSNADVLLCRMNEPRGVMSQTVPVLSDLRRITADMERFYVNQPRQWREVAGILRGGLKPFVETAIPLVRKRDGAEKMEERRGKIAAWCERAKAKAAEFDGRVDKLVEMDW